MHQEESLASLADQLLAHSGLLLSSTLGVGCHIAALLTFSDNTEA